MSAAVHLPPYNPVVASKTQAYQLTTYVLQTKLLLTVSTWSKVTLSRITGAAGAVRVATSSSGARDGFAIEPLVPEEIVLAPGDSLYYRSSISVALSVLVCPIPGVEI